MQSILCSETVSKVRERGGGDCERGKCGAMQTRGDGKGGSVMVCAPSPMIVTPMSPAVSHQSHSVPSLHQPSPYQAAQEAMARANSQYLYQHHTQYTMQQPHHVPHTAHALQGIQVQIVQVMNSLRSFNTHSTRCAEIEKERGLS